MVTNVNEEKQWHRLQKECPPQLVEFKPFQSHFLHMYEPQIDNLSCLSCLLI